MPRMQGASVNIGGQTNNFFFVDWTSTDSPSTNSTTITWNAYFKFTLADARLSSGSVNLGGASRASGLSKTFTGSFTTRDHYFTGGSFVVDHASDGTATLSGSLAIAVDTNFSSNNNGQSWALTNYTRTPNQPSTPTLISRDRENISMSTSATLPGGVNAAPAITSYTWQVAELSSPTGWSTIPGQTSSTLSYAAPSATTQYYFRVLATNSEGNSSYSSSSVLITGAPSQPVAPALSRTGTLVTPTLTTPASNGSTLSTFTLDYSTSSLFPLGDETITVANIGGSTPPAPAALIPGTTYYFRYKVGSNRGDSQPSPISTITIPPIPAAPAIPVPLSKQVRKVTVDWNAPTLNGAALASYQVEARYSSDGGSTWDNEFTLLGSTNNNTSIFTSEDLNIAKLYQFRVRALTDVGATPYSSTEELTEFNSIFISAYGYRHDGTNFNTAVQFAARYTGNSEDSISVGGTTYTGWKTIENVKRFDGSEFISLTQ
jgi:hypothetical protein